MKKVLLRYIKIYMALIMLSHVFFAYAQEEIDYSEQKNTIIQTSNDDDKTIWELKDNIKQLQEEKQDIDTQMKNLKESSDLGDFFRDDLSQDEIDEVTQIIEAYKILNTRINRELIETAEALQSTKTIKEEILEERKNLYKSLVPYIKIEKLSQYKQYIAWDANYLIEKKTVSENIVRKEEIIEQKVEHIENKIEENKKNIENILRDVIAQKIDEYLKNISENPKFIALSYDAKIIVIDGLEKQISDRVTLLQSNPATTINTIQKIDILEEVFSQKLEAFRNTIQK